MDINEKMALKRDLYREYWDILRRAQGLSTIGSYQGEADLLKHAQEIKARADALAVCTMAEFQAMVDSQ